MNSITIGAGSNLQVHTYPYGWTVWQRAMDAIVQ